MIFGSVLAGVGGAHAQRPSADAEERIERLLSGLTSPAFEVRRQSEFELRSLGMAALPRLRDVAATDELEVRYRVERIIADVERRGVIAALDRLDRGEEPEKLGVAYGWERFREQLGNDTETRELFAQMLRSEPALLRAVDGPPDQIQLEFESRCADLTVQRNRQRRATSPGLATIAALLFVGAQPECRPSSAAANCINTIVQQGEFNAKLDLPHPPEPLQVLLGQWIARADSASPVQRLSLAAQFNLTDGLATAREMIHMRALGPQIEYAVLYIAKFGSAQDVRDLEPLLDVATGFNAGRRGGREAEFTSRVQDVALAALLYLTHQEWQEYGFAEIRPNDRFLYTPNTIGFPDEETREAALEKWRRWAAANLRELQADPVWASEGTTT